MVSLKNSFQIRHFREDQGHPAPNTATTRFFKEKLPR
jgi:hypothetical protein